LRAANATTTPSATRSLATEALMPGPAPTMSAVLKGSFDMTRPLKLIIDLSEIAFVGTYLQSGCCRILFGLTAAKDNDTAKIVSVSRDVFFMAINVLTCVL